MNDLESWLGKADDFSISYDAGIQKTPLLTEGTSLGDNLSSIDYHESDNMMLGSKGPS